MDRIEPADRIVEEQEKVRKRLELDANQRYESWERMREQTGRFPADSRIELNGYTYVTDRVGRVREVSGTLRLGDGERDAYAQSMVGRGDGRRDTDEGGHLIAREFGGPEGYLNLTPMDATVNRGKYSDKLLGTFRNSETEMKKLIQDGHRVDVRIEQGYWEENRTGRPDYFRVRYTIDDSVSMVQVIENKADGEGFYQYNSEEFMKKWREKKEGRHEPNR
jgi:hypothetical protein